MYAKRGSVLGIATLKIYSRVDEYVCVRGQRETEEVGANTKAGRVSRS